MIYSEHFLQQMQLRNITMKDVEDTINNPEQIANEDGLIVYQKRLTENNKLYLLRIFVNEDKQPALAVTVYKTSKINKYFSI